MSIIITLTIMYTKNNVAIIALHGLCKYQIWIRQDISNELGM